MNSTGHSISIESHEYDESQLDFYKISLFNSLIPGNKYVINIKFIAPIHFHSLVGMYRSAYFLPDTGEAR